MKHQKILDDMFESMEKKANSENSRRTYLGMSSFGGFCERKQWLDFRHAFDPFIGYSSSSHFSDGHHVEALLIDRLMESGLDLKPVADDGSQFGFSDMTWLKGHSDGECTIDGDRYVWEAKSTDGEKQNKLRRLIVKDEHAALEKWSYQYFCQAQLYMGYSGIDKHILMAAAHGGRERINSKGDFRTVICETLFDSEVFESLRDKAKHIITTDKMPQAAWSLAVDKPLCIWKNGKCEAYDFCKGKEIGKPNCRNCGHVTFTTEGATCALGKEDLNEKNMLEFKECHKYNPELVHEFFVVDLDDEGHVHYRNESGTELVNRNSNDFRLEFNKLGG